MARNKYPEETEKIILETALKLFVEKGYDNTSIQDIINHLGGLSKGAIYHHFKSKEDILITLANEKGKATAADLMKVCRETTKNGYEKLKLLFRQSLNHTDKEILFQTAPNFKNNPQMLVLQIESIFEEIVPDYILPIMEEGIRDGSIQTDYPKELAEVMMLLSNLWINPLLHGKQESVQDTMRRVSFYKFLLQKLGLDLIDEEMLVRFEYLGSMISDKKDKDTCS